MILKHLKKASLMVFAVMALLAGNVSCSFEDRLVALEESVSNLKAQILSGAVITDVTTSLDGCTFTLSTGEIFKIINGKNGDDGTDGEAIIADFKIENDFIVLELKNGETLRISYQNPLSLVSMHIIPDFNDGSVYSFSDNGVFFLRIAVTPEEHLSRFEDNPNFFCRADFRKVLTKADAEDPDFSVMGEISSISVDDGYMTACFTLSDEEMINMFLNDYMVSFAIKDVDGIHGAATSLVPVSLYKRDGQGGDGEVVGLEYVDLGLSVKWANINLGAKNPGAPGEIYAWAATEPLNYPQGAWQFCPYCEIQRIPEISRYIVGISKYTPELNISLEIDTLGAMRTKMMHRSLPGDNVRYQSHDGLTKLELKDDAAAVKLGDGWRMPSKEEFEELYNNCDMELTITGTAFGFKFTSRKNGNSIFLPFTSNKEYKEHEETEYYVAVLAREAVYNEMSSGHLTHFRSGVYWTSSLYTEASEKGVCAYLCIPDGHRMASDFRYTGLPIRPVYVK